MKSLSVSRMRRAAHAGLAAVLLALVAWGCEATPTEGPGGAGAPSAGAPGPGAGANDAPSQPQGSSADVAVDTLYRSATSGLTAPTRTVIASPEDWEATWAQMTALLAPAPDVPIVDFASAVAVVLGLGQRPTGGYGLELAGVERAEGSLTVTVREVRPGPGCLSTQALTQPVLALAVARGPDPIRFREETLVRDCS